jgi:Asp-tRNA(Asn)/Glu-tRNA(Gln) amidotransferase B subunit
MKNQFPVKPPHLAGTPDYNLLARDVLSRFPEKASEYQQNKSVLNSLTGIIMKETRGSANPSLVSIALKRELERRG